MMEAPVKRKIVSQTSNDNASYLRSATNTPMGSNAATLKPKVTVSTIAQARPRNASPAPGSRTPLKVASPTHSVRSPSPIRITAKSSPVTRVTSPEFPKKPTKVFASSSAIQVVPRTKPAALTIGKRASASRVASPTPGLSVALRSVASAYSLPSSPATSAAPSLPTVSSLRPGPPRHHLRHNSVSDTSSLSTHSPSPSSSSLGTYDDRPESALKRVGSALTSAVGVRTASDTPSTPVIRVKSKVSSLAVASPPGPSLPSGLQGSATVRKASISSAGGRSATPRQRSPSISSTMSSPPASRPSPSGSTISRVKAQNIHFNNYQPFSVPPLPAPPAPDAIEVMLSHSPPRQALRSPPTSPLAVIFPRAHARTISTAVDATTSPGSSVATAREQPNGFSALGVGDPIKPSSSPEEPEVDMQAEARSNRKIADLEITNRSLMSINAMLEATKTRQAKEIRDLRRKLRETRLILPPRAFAAIRTSEAASAEHLPAAQSSAGDSGSDDDTEEDDVNPDPIFDRLSEMVELMIGHGKEAVDRINEPHDADDGGRTVKVLSADEVQRYHGTRSVKSTTLPLHEADDETDQSVHHDDSEAEVESEADTTLDDSFLDDIDDDYSGGQALPPLLTITSDSPVPTTSSFHIPSPTMK